MPMNDCLYVVAEKSAEHPPVQPRGDGRLQIVGIAVALFFLLTELCNAAGGELWTGIPMALAVAITFCLAKELPRLQALDVCVFVLAMVTLYSALRSDYGPNTDAPALRVAELVLFYTFLRTAGATYPLEKILVGMSCLGAALSLLCGLATAVRYAGLAAAGTGPAAAFRDQFATVQGETPAAWITVFLALLPFPVALLFVASDGSRRSRWIARTAVFLLTAAIGLTFSRGLYVATAVFLAAASFGAVSCGFGLLRTISRLVAPVALSGLLLAPVGGSVEDTLLMVRSTGRNRSLTGRMTVWKEAKAIVSGHLSGGAGPGNFAFEYSRRKSPGSPAVFSAFNIGLQVLTESGACGIVAWAALFIALWARLFRVWRDGGDPATRAVACILAAAAAALLVRDATYDSLTTAPVLAVLFMMLSISANLGATRCYAY